MTTDHPYRTAYQLKYRNGDTSLERTITGNVNASSKVHTVLPGQTIQNIALQYYGDSGSWYYIADFNNILDPFEEVIPGKELLIPY